MSGMKNKDQKMKTIWDLERYLLVLPQVPLSDAPKGVKLLCSSSTHIFLVPASASCEPSAYLIRAYVSQWSYSQRVCVPRCE